MFDNTKPIDYPKFEPAKFLGERFMVVKEGDFVVDGDGYLLQVTHGNYQYVNSEHVYDREINVHYLRAKYLGNRDDGLCHANQIRPASDDEIKEVREWLDGGIKYKVTSNGQLCFI